MVETSKQYAIRCAEIIKADKNISNDVILIMFVEYGNRLFCEKLKEHQKNQININQ